MKKEAKGVKVMIRFLAYMLLAAVAMGCSNLRYLGEDQELYTGSNIQIASDERIRERGLIEDQLQDVIYPQPNQTLLGLRPWLWFYNIAGEPTGRGIRYLLRERLGEPPVLFQEVDPLRTRRLMDNRLVNMGYFDSNVSWEVNRRNRKVQVDYLVSVQRPYRIRQLHPMQEESQIASHINESLERTILRENAPYRLETLRQERERIDQELKALGYFYFHPDVILFHADSTVGDRQVDLYPLIKPEMPVITTRQYRIGNVYLYADYLMDGMDTSLRSDTIELREGLYLFDTHGLYRHRVLEEAIVMQHGELYNQEDHNRTLNYLTTLGVFRFVNMRFIAVTQEDGEHRLDVRILLTPMDRKSISAEVRGVTKSTNFAGPGVLLAFTNRNFFGGAEDFRFNINASYETLMGQRDAPASSWELGGEAQLSYPRFVLPFGLRRPRRVLSPRTNISLGANYLNRTDALELTSFNFNYGYSWNRTVSLHHRLVPLVVNVFSLGAVHEGALGQMVDNIILRQALFEQFILGAEYSLIYNSQLRGTSARDYYYNLNLDSSGNLAWLASSLGAGNADEGFTLFNQSFAQFFKADIDVRHYRRLSGSTRLATRLILGAGFPYGNSGSLPYLKQFIIGGTNSIRAFHPRSLGPGAYAPPGEIAGRFNLLQAGEIILEANVEYRFDITTLFKGALFVDAGNVWRLREDENTPGGVFSFDTFLEQIAMGAGAGLRIDVNFFVLRFDFAFPLAVPYTDRPGFFEPVRPFRNMIFNLGIGYPF